MDACSPVCAGPAHQAGQIFLSSLKQCLRSPCVLLALAAFMSPAVAIESVRVPLEAQAIDLTKAIESYHSEGDRLLVSTAPGSDGIVRRIEVRAREEGTRPSWIVFALTNDTGEQIERLIVAPHFRLVGSGVIWPDLGASRISAMTASQGFPPERDESADADVFRLTLDPGTTVTYVAELRTPNLPQLTLWEPDAYKDKMTSLALYKGIVIGVAGAARAVPHHRLRRQGRGDLSGRRGARLDGARLCLHRLRILEPRSSAPRANPTASGAPAPKPSLPRRCSSFCSPISISIAGTCAPRMSPSSGSSFSPRSSALRSTTRRSRPASRGSRSRRSPRSASSSSLYLATHGYDRAIMLIPTWFLLLAWVIARGLHRHRNADQRSRLARADRRPRAHRHADRLHDHAERLRRQARSAHGAVSDVERKALALTGERRHHLRLGRRGRPGLCQPRDRGPIGPRAAARSKGRPRLGSTSCIRPSGIVSAPVSTRCSSSGAAGSIEDFRLRSADGHYFWFRLKARPVVGADGEVLRIVGILSDVTEAKIAEERLLHDAVHDNLTGLPNRELFFDRLDAALALAQTDRKIRPTVIASTSTGSSRSTRPPGSRPAIRSCSTIARRARAAF